MPLQSSHHVVQPIAIDVIDAQLCATRAALRVAPSSECLRMVGPQFLSATLSRVFKLSICTHKVHEAVAVDVADAQPRARCTSPRDRAR